MARAEFDPTSVQLATRIPKALHVRVRVRAIDEGVTLAEWIGDALRTHLARCTGKNRPGRATKTAEARPSSAA